MIESCYFCLLGFFDGITLFVILNKAGFVRYVIRPEVCLKPLVTTCNRLLCSVPSNMFKVFVRGWGSEFCIRHWQFLVFRDNRHDVSDIGSEVDVYL